MEEFTILLFRFSMAFAPQLWLAEMLFNHKHMRRRFFWLSAVLFGAAFSILPELLPDSYFCPWLTVGGWIRLSYPLLFLLSLLGLRLCFKAPFTDLLFMATMAYALQNCLYSLAEFVRLSSLPMLPSTLIRLGVMAAGYFLFYFFIIRKMDRHGSVGFKKLPILIFAVATLVVAYFVNMYMQAFDREVTSARLFNIIADLLLLVCLSDLLRNTRLQRDAEITEQLLKMTEQKHRLTQENIEIINRKCHDLKHQLDLYGAAPPDADRAEYLQELKNSIQIYDSSIQTGNKALDAVLMEKSLLFNRFSVDFSYIVDGACLSFMKNSDVFTLFGNALDNAFESLQAEKPENRAIVLKVNKHGKLVSICLENFCSRELQFEDGLPVSTKQNNGYHGFGMKSIRYVVQKYKGEMLVYKKERRFVLEILFTC